MKTTFKIIDGNLHEYDSNGKITHSKDSNGEEDTVFHNFCSVRKKADGKWHPIKLTDDKYLGYLGQYGKSQYQNGFTDEEFSDVEFELANLGIRLEKNY